MISSTYQNSVANHGFLPHNGYATILQFVDATSQVVGMGRKCERCHTFSSLMATRPETWTNIVIAHSCVGRVLGGLWRRD